MVVIFVATETEGAWERGSGGIGDTGQMPEARAGKAGGHGKMGDKAVGTTGAMRGLGGGRADGTATIGMARDQGGIEPRT